MPIITLCIVSFPQSLISQDREKLAMKELIQELQSDRYEKRVQARKQIVSDWNQWNDADLTLLEACVRGPEADLRSHATSILHAIQVRRSVGEDVVAAIPVLDQSVLSELDRASVLLAACRKYPSRRLLTRSLDRLVRYTMDWELSPDSKLEIANAVCTFRVFPFRPFALKWLDAKEESVRIAALEALAITGMSADALIIAGMLEHPSLKSQLKACQALVSISALDSEAAARVLRFIRSAEEPARQLAGLEIVSAHKLLEAKEIVLALAKSGDPEVIVSALRAAMGLRLPPEAHSLLPLLKHSHQRVATTAVQYASSYPVEGLLDQLVPILEDRDDGPWRCIAPLFLSQCKREGFEKVLSIALGENQWVTLRLADLISQLPLNEELLGKLCTAKTPHVRAASVEEGGRRRLDGLKDAFRTALSDSDPNVRGCAARALNRIGELKAEDLERLLHDPHAFVRLAAVELAKTSTHPIDIKAILQDLDAGVRRTAVGLIASRGEGADKGLKRLVLQDLDPWVRIAALDLCKNDAELSPLVRETIAGLFSHAKEDLVIASIVALPPSTSVEYSDLLCPLLAHSNENVRVAALHQLKANSGWDPAYVLPLLNADSPDVIIRALDVVPGAKPSRTVNQHLGKFLSHASAEVRIAALYALMAMRSTQHVGSARTLLRDEHPSVKIAALRFLQSIADSESLPEFKRLLGHEEASVRWEAIEAISRVGGPPHLGEIAKLIQSKHPGDREKALSAIMADPKPHLEQVREILRKEGETPNVVEAALRVLATLDPDEIWADCARWLTSPIDSIRHQAIESLSRAKVESCISWLRDLSASDADPRVRASAGLALWAGGIARSELEQQATAEGLFGLGRAELFFANDLLNKTSQPESHRYTLRKFRLDIDVSSLAELANLMRDQGLKVAPVKAEVNLAIGMKGEETTQSRMLLRLYSACGIVPVFLQDGVHFLSIEESVARRVQRSK